MEEKKSQKVFHVITGEQVTATISQDTSERKSDHKLIWDVPYVMVNKTTNPMTVSQLDALIKELTHIEAAMKERAQMKGTPIKE